MNDFSIAFYDKLNEKQVSISVEHSLTDNEIKKAFTKWYINLNTLPENPSKDFEKFLRKEYE